MMFGEKVTCRSEFRESEKVQKTKHGRRNVFFFSFSSFPLVGGGVPDRKAAVFAKGEREEK